MLGPISPSYPPYGAVKYGCQGSVVVILSTYIATVFVDHTGHTKTAELGALGSVIQRGREEDEPGAKGEASSLSGHHGRRVSPYALLALPKEAPFRTTGSKYGLRRPELDKAAAECLKQLNWALEPAIDHFYTCGKYSSAPSIDNRAIETLYKSYKGAGIWQCPEYSAIRALLGVGPFMHRCVCSNADRDEDAITAEGIMKFCADLKVEPADVVMLVIACYMNAAYMGEFTKDEFISGMVKLGCDSMDKLRNKLPELRAELKSPSRFKDIYNYAYTFSREKGQKCVQLDTALGMWQLLFPADRPWPLLDDWCEFLTKQHGGKAISKDTWTQLLDFIRTVKPDLSNFDPDNSAWPYLIDEVICGGSTGQAQRLSSSCPEERSPAEPAPPEPC
ncbi:hypothetical protein QJQ45_014367 [Haematococcus lacustris]|nr:hypothetical protein QJQ45_014367 [Haematococcus lacustris]